MLIRERFVGACARLYTCPVRRCPDATGGDPTVFKSAVRIAVRDSAARVARRTAAAPCPVPLSHRRPNHAPRSAAQYR
jgi:hypothetical protein